MQMLGGKDSGGSNASYDGGMDQSGGSDEFNQAPARQSAPANQSAVKPATSQSGGGSFDDFEDDIPF
jgi:single-strand DNA-binding protein